MDHKIQFTVAMIGLDNGGKTTLCRKTSANQLNIIYPTQNFEIHYLSVQKIDLPVLVYDCSGIGKAR